jgi:N-acetylneuraminate synthase/N,N'-diacetyllegionaminate synthase
MLNKFFMNKTIYIIAEIGVNHNNSRELGTKLILGAKKSGANFVKFQTFKADRLALKNTPKVNYQLNCKKNSETHYQMLKKLELSDSDHLFFLKFSKKIKIDFISTPYSVEDAKFLSSLKINIYKTSSADLVDHNLHEYLAKSNKKVIISTGMATIKEITEVVKIYKKYKNKNISLLHCVSNYPCSNKSLNMRNIIMLKEKYNFPVGFSDHSTGNVASVLALSMGATIFEKHLTLKKSLIGPDHKSSCTIFEFKNFVDTLYLAKDMLGNYSRKIQQEEKQMRLISRKSLVYNDNVEAGKVITKNLLTAKRPGNGILVKKFKFFINKKLKKKVFMNNKVKYSDFH